MSEEEKVEAIEKIGKALKKPFQGVDATERVPANKEQFTALLNQGQEQQMHQTQTATKEVDKVSSISMMDEINKLNAQVSQLKRLGPEEIRNNAKDIVVRIEQAKVDLNELHEYHSKASELHGKEIADAALSPQQRRMQQRLTHIDESLKIALSKAGVEYQAYVPPKVEPGTRTNPIKSFVGYLTNSQFQLDNLGNTIAEMGATNAQLTPMNMLAIQMKMGLIQQQLELFTSALNKSLESMKTLMNVQV